MANAMSDPFGYYRWHDQLYWVRDWHDVLCWEPGTRTWVEAPGAWRVLTGPGDPAVERLDDGPPPAWSAR